MKLSARIIFLTLIIFSCARKEHKLDILPEKKMRDVMWDMIRADQYVSDFIMKDTTRNKKEESVKLYDQIFHLHKVTRDQFRKSLAYYSSRPDLFRPIIDSLAIRRSELPPVSIHPVTSDSALKIKQPFQHKSVPRQ